MRQHEEHHQNFTKKHQSIDTEPNDQ